MERPSSSGFIAAAVVLLGAFIVWLCAQMAATDPANETILLTIGGALVLSVLALALGSWRPGGYHRRSRARSSVGERSLHTRGGSGKNPCKYEGGRKSRGVVFFSDLLFRAFAVFGAAPEPPGLQA
jgi:hypothetical protein